MMIQSIRYIAQTTRQFFFVVIPLLYLGVGIFIGWIYIQQQDRIFRSHVGNFFIQGRWESDDTLRSLEDLRVDSRYGYFPLGEFNAVAIQDDTGMIHYPSIAGYKVISDEEFIVEFSQGFSLQFFSYEDGIAIEAIQDEMPYTVEQVYLSFELNPSATLLEDGVDTRLQLDGLSYAIEGNFEESRYLSESKQISLQWVESMGFDRLHISSNLFGQPKSFAQWVADTEQIELWRDRYQSTIDRYLSRAKPVFSQRYNADTGLWRNLVNDKYEFNLPATLTRLPVKQSGVEFTALWGEVQRQDLVRQSEFPLWLTPWSGQIISSWNAAQRTFSTQERAWSQQISQGSNLFTNKHLYTDIAIAAPQLIPRLTTLARSVRTDDTPASIIYKVHFLLQALINQNSRENITAIQRQLEALEKHIVFLKKGIYILFNDRIEIMSMLDYAVLLQNIQRSPWSIPYRNQFIIESMIESLTLGAIDFSNPKGDIPQHALWNEGRPLASEEYLGLEHFYELFEPLRRLPTVHFASVGRDQRVLSAADNVVIRTLSPELIELRVESALKIAHYFVLTSLVRPVTDVTISGRRVPTASNLEQVKEGYFYDRERRLLYVKIEQSNTLENVRITIEPPPPPPPKEDEKTSAKETSPVTEEPKVVVEKENPKKKR
ncbi:hypothetical protein PVA45_03335 [Entomospira entomophila]|uniref:Uncharacterized protein n=1 Tax=Entomospira entomophila TaxID=2719988 RepID=A0A968KTP6_9SPIO|nr:hypothetical protein [Entomospira entomophilus]NIZ40546.1 hypothetical protein [Entomospira entomophilus]WDI36104.1 hypothetical protein PVA45_03335 [Entomospira entomophilus]